MQCSIEGIAFLVDLAAIKEGKIKAPLPLRVGLFASLRGGGDFRLGLSMLPPHGLVAAREAFVPDLRSKQLRATPHHSPRCRDSPLRVFVCCPARVFLRSGFA